MVFFYSFFFLLEAPGSPIITSQDEDIQASSLIVKWTRPADGGSPITTYRVVLLYERTEIRNENITDFTTDVFKARAKVIESLNISTNYTVKVFARNFVFEGEAGEKTIRTKFRGEYCFALHIGTSLRYTSFALYIFLSSTSVCRGRKLYRRNYE